MLESRCLLSAGGRVVGYFPEYRWDVLGPGTGMNFVDFSSITHLNYFSIRANGDGSLSTAGLVNTSHLDIAVGKAHARGVTISIVIDPGSAFTTLDASPAATNAFVSNITAFCAAHSLDGIDLDWEPAWATATTDQINNYANLIDNLRIGAPNLLLSAAVLPVKLTLAGQVPGPYVINPPQLSKLDFIEPMGYDLDYANHSAYTDWTADMNGWGSYLVSNGVSKTHLIPGVPFYGKAGHSWADSQSRTYTELIERYHAMNGGYPAPSADSVNVTFSDSFGGATMSWYFNGPTTVQSKAQFVVNGGFGGVMIWELGQDHFTGGAFDAYSLLPVIKSVINPPFASMDGSGIVTVNGDSTGEAFTIGVASSNLIIKRNGVPQSFSLASVNGIVINGSGGDDTVDFNGGTTKPITFNGGTGIDTLRVNSGTYAFAADAAAGNAALSVIVNSGGSVVFNSAAQHIAALTINSGGTVTVPSNGNRVLVTKALAISGGRLDLADNTMILDYTGGTPAATLRTWLIGGRNGGAWNGTSGIMTSAVAGTPYTGLGYGEASQLFTDFPATFAGQSIDNTALLVRYTYDGDANLDRTVDVNDLAIFAANFQGSPRIFSTGDFDYNDVVNQADQELLSLNWQKSMEFGGGSSPSSDVSSQIVSIAMPIALPVKTALIRQPIRASVLT